MSFVEQLKSSVDIVAVVGQYVRLKRSGSGQRWLGLCPFHAEKTPSFSVHAAHQFFKCFGCGIGGDVIRFVMEIERMTFWEAVKLLAERHGIPLPRREYADPETRLRAAVYRMYELAAEAFRRALYEPAGAGAREYLARRGVDEALQEEFGLGYADASGSVLTRLLAREGFAAEELEASGLLLRRADGGFFDRFRGRLMFPIHSESGKIVAFAGRALEPGDEPKYLNSPETAIYRKSFVLYNMHRAREAIRRLDQVVLVEGYMDVIGLWSAGVRHVVASCGTALAPQQVRILRRHSENVVVNFDSDAAGASAAERSIQALLDEGLRVRILELDGGLDPDEYVRQRGAAAYLARLEKAPGYFHWLADRARARWDLNTTEGRLSALRFLLPAVQRLPDRLERAAVASELAAYLGIEVGSVLEHFRRSAERRQAMPEAPRSPALPAEKILIQCLLRQPGIRREIAAELARLDLEALATRRILQALAALDERHGYAELEGRLEESDRELLAALVLADEVSEEALTPEQAWSCLEGLRMAGREAQRSRLRTLIRQAERAGDFDRAMRLTAELAKLDRS
ncbi:MAG: DNA primase [Bryobacterales bacterium]|nr:DNA primase [Bryobacteraceae bacterium]MDW8130167.1 DNA primase [Bryobacterales bacterium]